MNKSISKRGIERVNVVDSFSHRQYDDYGFTTTAKASNQNFFSEKM